MGLSLGDDGVMTARFGKNIEEIRSSRALRIYGFALSLTHVLTWVYWTRSPGTMTLISDREPLPVCWPWLEKCASHRLGLPMVRAVFTVYLVLGLMACAAFLVPRLTLRAWGLLLALALLQGFVVLQDFRMMDILYPVTFLITFIYLSLPGKKDLLRWSLVAFSVTEGVFRLQPEWLSGALLTGNPWFHGHPAREAYSIYAVILEIFFVFGVLARSSWIFWAAFIQLLLFDMAPLRHEGFHSPCVLACLLLILPLARSEENHADSSLLARGLKFRLSWTSYLMLGLLGMSQVFPLIRSGDRVITGRWRAFLLDPVRVPLTCSYYLISRFRNTYIDEITQVPAVRPAIQCDPVRFWSAAHDLCHRYREKPDFIDLDLALFTRRTGEGAADYQRVMDIRDFCRRDPKYGLVGRDSWIHPDGKGPGAQDPVSFNPAMPQVPPVYQNPVLVDALSSQVEPGSLYRGDAGHTGVAPGHAILGTRLERQWKLDGLNRTDYTASKASPAIDDSGIYVGSDTGWFYALDFQGRILWKLLAEGTSHGIHGTAALDEARVYFGAYNGTFYALDKRTGSFVWIRRLGRALGASPLIYDRSIIAGIETSRPANGYLVRLRATDGKLIWESSWLGEQDHSSPTLDVKDHLVYGGANNGYFQAFDLDTGKRRWEFNTGGAVKSTSALDKKNDRIYLTSWSGNIFALDAPTGKLIWKTALGWRSRTSPTLVPGLGMIVVANERGEIFGVRERDGAIRWRIEGKFSPMIASALVVRRSAKGDSWVAWLPCKSRSLCALDPKEGRTVATYPLEGAMTSVPVAWGGALYVALNRPGGLIKLISK